MVVVPRYDVLELKYSNGGPAVLRHVDGSGFAYYPSGRKAICVSAYGADGRGKTRRFGAIIHDDTSRSPVMGSFDDWGRGSAEGQKCSGEEGQAPKVVIGETAVIVIDGSGKSTEVPLGVHNNRRLPADATHGSAGSADIVLRLNDAITLLHRMGRTSLDFQSGGVSHTFVLGELQGEEVAGMPAPAPVSLAEDTMREIGGANDALSGMCAKVSGLKVDASAHRNKKRSQAGSQIMKAGSSDIQAVLQSLSDLTESLAHPDLAPANLQWTTEGGLKKLLAASHPQCPGLDRKNCSIARFSGKCTEERLANTKPTVATPKTVSLISQLKLPELVDECAPKGTLLVVICLANYAMEQSNYAKLLAEKVHAEIWKRFQSRGPEGQAPPVRFVAIELTELGGFAQRYGVKEVPYCLMFQSGSVVYSQRLRGMRIFTKDAVVPQSRILLVEFAPLHQLRLEKCLRRSGCAWDLAMDAPQAMRLAAREVSYDAVLLSGRVSTDQRRSIASAVQRQKPGALVLMFDAEVGPSADESQESWNQFVKDCSHVFPYAPSYAAIMALLSRGDSASERRLAAAGLDKRELVEEVLSTLDRGRRPLTGAAEAVVDAA